MTSTLVFTLFFILAFVFILKDSIIVVKQQEAIVIESLGKFSRILYAGLHFIVPFVDAPRRINRIEKCITRDGHTYYAPVYSKIVDLKETVYDFQGQNIITKDNVKINVNVILDYQIIDPKKAVYQVENLPEAIKKLTQTNLRNLVGQLSLDEALVSRDVINDELREIFGKVADKWGIKVNRVELQDIIPPESIQQSMEKEKKTEQE
ncbi:paraslipin [bacterium]|nr:paraslipin [bacterium]